MDIQELVARARLLLSRAPERLKLFNLVNGKRSAKDIAKITHKSLSVTLQNLQKMKDLELIYPRKDDYDKVAKKDNSVLYEKNRLLKHLSYSIFKDPTRLPQKPNIGNKRRVAVATRDPRLPSDQEILAICKDGEDQLHEFKRAGVEMKVLSKEICAFANTKMGGIIFYGVEDDGSISGSDMQRQKLDQSIQNSVRSNVSPALSVKVVQRDILGYVIILIQVPPWDKKNVYHFDNRVYIRKGTNVFIAKPEESKSLHQGTYLT